ncbi:MAG: tyrosine-protein phosphatase [Lachnospiraceae bacterium]
MIDIHTHILPGVDDGSESMEMSLEMLSLADRGGTTALVVTPHCNLPGLHQDIKILTDKLELLRKKAKEVDIPITIFSGMELFASWNLPELLADKKVWTLNNTHYFLVEFDFGEDPRFCNEVLERCVERHYYPIIAHPERYLFVQRSPEIVYHWICAGYGIQVNKGSLLGRFGIAPQRTAQTLMDCGLVSCVASDAHFPWMRTPYMGEVRELIETNYGFRYAHMVLEENPHRILTGQTLTGLKPLFPRR